MKITFKLNEKKVLYNGSPTTRLIDFMREKSDLTSCKEGCGEGECGACSVLIDNRLSLACITPMGQVHNRSVLSLEGIKETKEFEILRNSFEKYNAVQCGFCTPGIIMAAYSLLKSVPSPTEDEIKEAISGNLCRCTGYISIIEAIKSSVSEVNLP